MKHLLIFATLLFAIACGGSTSSATTKMCGSVWHPEPDSTLTQTWHIGHVTTAYQTCNSQGELVTPFAIIRQEQNLMTAGHTDSGLYLVTFMNDGLATHGWVRP